MHFFLYSKEYYFLVAEMFSLLPIHCLPTSKILGKAHWESANKVTWDFGTGAKEDVGRGRAVLGNGPYPSRVSSQAPEGWRYP